MELAINVLDELNRPVEIQGVAIDADVRAGIVTELEPSNDAETVFRHANAALFYGSAVTDKISVFAGDRNQEHVSRLLLMGDLRHAVNRRELRLFCQPKVDMNTLQIVGAEVLVRWDHPKLGMISPSSFIKIAEQSGVIVEVTRHLLDMSFSWISVWGKEGRAQKLAINLSAHDLLSSKIISYIKDLMVKWQIHPDCIEFELTESALIDDPLAALEVLSGIKDIGFQLLIDDFGTGYSSLSYLQRFPFDVIKIDQSFVMPMLDSPDSAAIVHSTIELGHILGRKVIAEGVESAEVWKSLQARGCDIAQGYFITAPIPIEEFPGWQATWDARCVGLDLFMRQ
jgi:EAL domain-containing protein (putative c-di-GMP-specific phosphodiesterase class I)